MKSYRNKDKEMLFLLLSIAVIAGFSGHLFENIKIAFSGNASLYSASAIMATEQNLAPQVSAPNQNFTTVLEK